MTAAAKAKQRGSSVVPVPASDPAPACGIERLLALGVNLDSLMRQAMTGSVLLCITDGQPSPPVEVRWMRSIEMPDQANADESQIVRDLANLQRYFAHILALRLKGKIEIRFIRGVPERHVKEEWFQEWRAE